MANIHTTFFQEKEGGADMVQGISMSQVEKQAVLPKALMARPLAAIESLKQMWATDPAKLGAILGAGYGGLSGLSEGGFNEGLYRAALLGGLGTLAFPHVKRFMRPQAVPGITPVQYWGPRGI